MKHVPVYVNENELEVLNRKTSVTHGLDDLAEEAKSAAKCKDRKKLQQIAILMIAAHQTN